MDPETRLLALLQIAEATDDPEERARAVEALGAGEEPGGGGEGEAGGED